MTTLPSSEGRAPGQKVNCYFSATKFPKFAGPKYWSLTFASERLKANPSMLKPFVGLLSISCLLASCAAPPQAARSQASAGQSASAASINNVPADNDDQYETVFVPPPVGSLLGGGSVRVPKKTITGTDENALVGNIRRLNAAAGSADERPFVVAAVSRVTVVTERELQAQQEEGGGDEIADGSDEDLRRKTHDFAPGLRLDLNISSMRSVTT